MASSTSNSFIFVWFILPSFLLSLFLFSLEEGYAFEEIREGYLTHTFQLSSLLPSSVCNHSSKADEKMSTLKVVNKYGPCFQPNRHNKAAAVTPSHRDILWLDRSRANSSHSRPSKNLGRLHRDMLEMSPAPAPVAQAPVSDGESFDSYNFVVKVGLGTPMEEFSLMLDTGSDLTWTQCEPCKECYDQIEKIFDPSQSSTYFQVPNTDPACSYVDHPRQLYKGHLLPELDSICVYAIKYLDEASSEGYCAKETLTFSQEKMDGFLFGCGYEQEGGFGGEAGIMGLSQENASIVSQTATKYNKIFSYCLPSSTSSTGHLTFGGPSSLPNAKYTKLISTQKSPEYGVDLIGINLGGKKLPIDESLFKNAGTVIDSGTPLTRLPEQAYTVLRDEFVEAMTALGYTMVTKDDFTCYDFSEQSGKITVPVIGFVFSDGTELDIPEKSSLVTYDEPMFCLAFAANEGDNKRSIIGNQVQRTMEVVYDVAGGRIGFAPGGCN